MRKNGSVPIATILLVTVVVALIVAITLLLLAAKAIPAAQSLEINYTLNTTKEYAFGPILNTTLTLYKQNNHIKIISFGIIGHPDMLYVPSGNLAIICAPASNVTSFLGYSCNKISPTNLDYKYNLLLDTPSLESYNSIGSVSYVGKKAIAGRVCNDLKVGFNLNQINQNQSVIKEFAPHPVALTNLTTEECLDSQYGYLALLNVSVIFSRNLCFRGGVGCINSTSYILKAEHVSTGTSPANFTIPHNVSLP